MSHFTVLVIGDGHEQQLAPFHEYECTGNDDEFVIDVDKTEEALADWEKDTSKFVKLPDGELVCRYDDRFQVELPPDPDRLAITKIGTQWCGWYRGGKFWSSYGTSVQKCLDGMIRDGWLYA